MVEWQCMVVKFCWYGWFIVLLIVYINIYIYKIYFSFINWVILVVNDKCVCIIVSQEYDLIFDKFCRNILILL